MRKLDELKRLKEGVLAKTSNPGLLKEDLKRLKDSAAALVNDAEARDNAKRLGIDLFDAAIEGADLRNKSGGVSKSGIANAAARPPVAIVKATKGVGKELYRQARYRRDEASDQESN